MNSQDILFLSDGNRRPYRIWNFDNNCNVVRDIGSDTLRYNNIPSPMSHSVTARSFAFDSNDNMYIWFGGQNTDNYLVKQIQVIMLLALDV